MLGLVALLFIVLGMSRLGDVNANGKPVSAASSQPERHIHVRLFGLNFGPYTDDEGPDVGAVITEAHLRERLQIVAPYTMWIRTFGSTHGLEQTGAVARGLGLKTALGAWLSADRAANERELDNLIAAARQGQVDIVIVGSEVLLRRDLSEAHLIAYIRRAQRALPGIPVSTADVYSVLLSHPAVIDAVDIVLGARSHISGQASNRATCEVAIRFNRFQRPAL
jgi:exo-beta-1,3-glucanase (GH17 family)